MSGAIKLIGATASIAFILAGCAQQQQQPVTVAPQPIYNKFGEAIGCEGGGELNPSYDPNGGLTGEYENPCEPEECEDGYVVGAADIPCDPPRERDDPQRTPTPPQTVGTPITNIP